MENGKKIIKRRKFSKEFKLTLVGEYESGKFTVLELSRLHKVPFQLIYKWIYKYSTYNKPETRIVEMKNSSTQKLKDYERQVKELEQLLGQKQIRLEYLEKLIEIASKEYGIEIEKNLSTRPSNGFGPTHKV